MLTLGRLKELKREQREEITITKLLSVIIGECEQISRNPTHNEILGVIQKIYKENSETIKELAPNGEFNWNSPRKETMIALKIENQFLTQFLPQPLTENELIVIINSQIAAGQNISGIMKYLSENYKGRYDGKGAARLCNIYLKGTVL